MRLASYEIFVYHFATKVAGQISPPDQFGPSGTARTVILGMVQEITLDELCERWQAVEAAADATPGIDRWCSGPDWQVPVAKGFSPRGRRLLLSGEDGLSFACLARYRSVDGRRMLGGMEPMWGFGCPLLAADQPALAGRLAQTLGRRTDWSILFLSGMPTIAESPNVSYSGDPGATIEVAAALQGLGQIGFAEGITRQVANLSDGYDGWLSRRSSRFRRNLRQAARRAETAGLQVVDVSQDPDVFERILAIEHRSWKGHQESGITSVEMEATYREMVARLQKRGRLHAHVAQLDDADAGYILGGVRNGCYRGLQLSYTEHARSLSVGNLLQDHQLRLLDEHELAHTYDLGMDFDYKRRWADEARTTITLVVERT